MSNEQTQGHSLLTCLKEGVKRTRTVTWPGTDQEVRIRVLTEADYQKAAIETDHYYRDQNVTVSSVNYEERVAMKDTRILHRALVDSEGRPLFLRYSDLTEVLKDSVRAYLIEQLEEHQKECSPRISEMGEEEFNELYETVKKNPGTVSTISDTAVLRRLVTSLVSRPAMQQTDS